MMFYVQCLGSVVFVCVCAKLNWSGPSLTQKPEAEDMQF